MVPNLNMHDSAFANFGIIKFRAQKSHGNIIIHCEIIIHREPKKKHMK